MIGFVVVWDDEYINTPILKLEGPIQSRDPSWLFIAQDTVTSFTLLKFSPISPLPPDTTLSLFFCHESDHYF